MIDASSGSSYYDCIYILVLDLGKFTAFSICISLILFIAKGVEIEII